MSCTSAYLVYGIGHQGVIYFCDNDECGAEIEGEWIENDTGQQFCDEKCRDEAEAA